MLKELWRSSVTVNKSDVYAHVIDFDGDLILEVVSPRETFLKRFIRAVKYVSKGGPLVFSQVLLDKEKDVFRGKGK